MDSKKIKHAAVLYSVLSALFVAALVTTNLIANKFVQVDLGFYVFEISAGVLPYPLTFLITDILSEIYGQKKTQRVVFAGFFSSVLVLGILWLGHTFPAIENSPVNNEGYTAVFKSSGRVIFSSMIAYLAAQFVDVRLFHFWKRLTNGKHLWIRNNFSTVLSQLTDTTLVVAVLFWGRMSWTEMGVLILNGWAFKVLVAFVDTPFLYAAVFGIKKYFGLRANEEILEDGAV